MKKKNLLLVFILITMIWLPVVKAYPNNGGYYYETESGTYMLCGGSAPTCTEVTKGQSGVIFNLNASEIIYNNESFIFDIALQENYNQTLNGKTRMFYYINKSNNYVLCTTSKSCKTYTFDKLTSVGAVINHPTSISFKNGDGPGVEGDVYYFSAEQQTAYNEKNNIGEGSGSGTDNSGNATPETSNESCTRLKEPLKFIGNIVLIAKIAIPIIIIIFGMIDFFRAVMGSKDDEMKKSIRSLIFRCISGVVIFLLPTIVSVIFSLIDSWVDIKGDFNYCQKCVLNVSECK